MVWRSVIITNPVSLKLKDKQLQVVKDKEVSTIPVEDLAIILIDSYTNISTSLLSFLAENYVVVVVCDKKHNPSSILLPFLQHYRFTDILKLQMECSLPLQKRLWQKIVEQKIINQAKVLSLYKKEEALKLLNFSKKVLSGDTSNMEGQAARMYWKNFFARDFKRKKENFCNFAPVFDTGTLF